MKHNANYRYFEIIDSEDKAYWLGFIAADGCIHERYNGNRSLNLSSNIRDLYHLQKFKKSIQCTQNFCRRDQVHGISISSQDLFYDLVDKGITPRKSLTLKPPLNVPEDLIRHWIRGYFDGDGSIHIYFDKRPKHHKNPFKFRGSFAGTKEVLDFIKENIKISGSVRKPKSKNIYYLRFSGKYQTEKVYDYLYNKANIFLERKKLIFDERKSLLS